MPHRFICWAIVAIWPLLSIGYTERHNFAYLRCSLLVVAAYAKNTPHSSLRSALVCFVLTLFMRIYLCRCITCLFVQSRSTTALQESRGLPPHQNFWCGGLFSYAKLAEYPVKDILCCYCPCYFAEFFYCLFKLYCNKFSG